MNLCLKLLLSLILLFVLQGHYKKVFAMQVAKNVTIPAYNQVQSKSALKKIFKSLKQKKVKDFDYLDFIKSGFLKYLVRLLIGLTAWGVGLLLFGLFPNTWVGYILFIVFFYIGLVFIFGENVAEFILDVISHTAF